MNDDEKQLKVTISLPLLTLLTILFMTLKLSHVIAWSWWWVLAPLWLPTVAVIGFMGVVMLCAILLAIL